MNLKKLQLSALSNLIALCSRFLAWPTFKKAFNKVKTLKSKT